MLPNLDTLWTLIDQLDGEAECVTFYDAMALIRVARHFEDLPQGLIADWIALHDAPHVTDGARTVLAHYLQRVAKDQAKARRLARQLIVLKDSGKTLRATVGHTFAVALEAREHLGYAWVLAQKPQCTDVAGPSIDETMSRFGVLALGVGQGLCRWEEHIIAVQPPRYAAQQSRIRPTKRRSFQIFVVIEA